MPQSGTNIQNNGDIRMSQLLDGIADTDAATVGQLKVRLPSGVIVMWSGSIASIPVGWVLCDGQNGTPNLRDRFIVGAGNSYAVADIGGAASVTLDITQIPSHTHIQNSHTHTVPIRASAGSTATSVSDAGTTGTTGNITSAAATATNQNTGGGLGHENRPPYYALAYIMKT